MVIPTFFFTEMLASYSYMHNELTQYDPLNIIGFGIPNTVFVKLLLPTFLSEGVLRMEQFP